MRDTNDHSKVNQYDSSIFKLKTEEIISKYKTIPVKIHLKSS